MSVHAVRVHGADDDHRQLYSAGAGGTSAGERQDTANTTTRTSTSAVIAYSRHRLYAVKVKGKKISRFVQRLHTKRL